MRADGRMIFLCTVAAFCAVAVWWGWRISQPVGVPAVPHSRATSRAAAEELALNTFLRREADAQRYIVPPTPFLYIERRRPPRRPPPDDNAVAQPVQPEDTQPVKPPDDTATPVKTPTDTPERPPQDGEQHQPMAPVDQDPPVRPPPPPDPGPPLRLTYRGYMYRPDGSLLALIEDSRSERAAFHPVGTNLFGITIQHPDGDTLEVLSVSGAAYTIRRGQPVYFINGEPRER